MHGFPGTAYLASPMPLRMSSCFFSLLGLLLQRGAKRLTPPDFQVSLKESPCSRNYQRINSKKCWMSLKSAKMFHRFFRALAIGVRSFVKVVVINIKQRLIHTTQTRSCTGGSQLCFQYEVKKV